jgi:uncharacterized repeat protein (TIGR01451 family)
VASPSPFVVGQAGTYTLTVSNAGPDLAADVVVTDALPANVMFVSASAGAGFSNGNIVYAAGNLVAGAFASVSVTVTPTASGTLTNTVQAASVTSNSNPSGGASILLTTVSDGGVTAPVLSPGNASTTTNGFSISLQSVAGETYILQYKNSLTEPGWTNVPGATVAGTGGVVVLQDNSAGTDRFYRVAAQ